MERSKFTLFLSITLLALFGCGGGSYSTDGSSRELPKENLQAKESLQGIWVDDESETVLFKVKGDSIYYPDSTSTPFYFQIIDDSLYLMGVDTIAYKIDQQTKQTFSFHSMTDEIVKVNRSESPTDSLMFMQKTAPITSYASVIKKDSIFSYDGKRYHGYIFINPTKMKVVCTSYSDEGISIENVYYDNIIHICVYEGKNNLFSKDVKKNDFADVVPEQFLQQAILKDINFTGVNAHGYRFEASLANPEGASSYLVEMNVDADRNIHCHIKGD